MIGRAEEGRRAPEPVPRKLGRRFGATCVGRAGPLLFTALGVWAFAAGGPAALGAASTAAGCGLLWALGCSGGRVSNRLAAGVAVAAGAWAFASATPWFKDFSRGGIATYPNATAAFANQGVLACLLVAHKAGTRRHRSIALVAAGGMAAFVIFRHSAAAAVLLVFSTTALVSSRRMRRVAVATCAMAVAVALLVSAGLGFAYNRNRQVPGVLVSSLNERRLALWGEAEEIMAANPVAGVGYGNFQRTSATAMSDPDARWAHHGFLQQGAEAGFSGLVLLVLLFGWGFVRIWRSGSTDAVASLAAGSLASIGVHACVDYVLHFPLVPVAAAVILGLGVATPKGTE